MNQALAKLRKAAKKMQVVELFVYGKGGQFQKGGGRIPADPAVAARNLEKRKAIHERHLERMAKRKEKLKASKAGIEAIAQAPLSDYKNPVEKAMLDATHEAMKTAKGEYMDKQKALVAQVKAGEITEEEFDKLDDANYDKIVRPAENARDKTIQDTDKAALDRKGEALQEAAKEHEALQASADKHQATITGSQSKLDALDKIVNPAPPEPVGPSPEELAVTSAQEAHSATVAAHQEKLQKVNELDKQIKGLKKTVKNKYDLYKLHTPEEAGKLREMGLGVEAAQDAYTEFSAETYKRTDLSYGEKHELIDAFHAEHVKPKYGAWQEAKNKINADVAERVEVQVKALQKEKRLAMAAAKKSGIEMTKTGEALEEAHKAYAATPKASKVSAAVEADYKAKEAKYVAAETHLKTVNDQSHLDFITADHHAAILQAKMKVDTAEAAWEDKKAVGGYSSAEDTQEYQALKEANKNYWDTKKVAEMVAKEEYGSALKKAEEAHQAAEGEFENAKIIMETSKTGGNLAPYVPGPKDLPAFVAPIRESGPNVLYTAPVGSVSLPSTYNHNLASKLDKDFYASNLDYNEKGAIGSYTGSTYQTMNGDLRKFPDKPVNPEDGYASKATYNLDKAIKKQVEYEEPITVYRGMHFNSKDQYEQFVKQVTSANEFRNYGFFSTSVHGPVAKKFADGGWSADGKRGLLFKIQAKKGVWTDGHGYAKEKEFIINHKSRFKVTGYKQTSNGTPVIEIKQLE